MSKTVAGQRKTKKRRLSTDTIVQAAVAVLEADGIDALNMRRIAGDLGVSPMALYRHFSTKEELLAAIAGYYFAVVEIPDTSGRDWRTAIAASILAVHRAFLDHPHLGSIIALQHVDVVAIFQASELILQALADAGLGADEAVQALDVLTSFAMGFTQRKASLRRGKGASRLQKIEAIPSGRFENVVAVAEQISTLDVQHTFESGLDWILDGIEARVQQSRTNTALA